MSKTAEVTVKVKGDSNQPVVTYSSTGALPATGSTGTPSTVTKGAAGQTVSHHGTVSGITVDNPG